MALTIYDIKERLKRYDEVSVLELLEITTEDLLERFEDLLINKADYIEEQLGEE